MADAGLPLTGERTVPGIEHENYWFRRHEAAYLHLRPLVSGRRILEVGSGEGYGTALLAADAVSIVGIDYDRAAVAHAARAYPAARFVRANLAALPIASRSHDVVVTLQVIEHVWDHAGFVGECQRVLRPGGLLVVTTPNRLTFSPGLDAPVNPFHTKEFTAPELTGLLTSRGFGIDTVAGLHPGARVAELDARYGDLVAAQLAAAPADWSAGLLRDVASLAASDFVVVTVAERDVDESLDLVVVARRPVD